MSNPLVARRRGGVAVLLVAGLLALTACSVDASDDDDETTRAAGPAWKAVAAASDDPTATPSGGSSDLPFDAVLDPATRTQWGDTLVIDPDWELTQPDDGAGSWAYTHLSTGCELWFWQGTVESDAVDDRAISDELIAFHTGGTVADVGAAAGELAVPVGIPGENRMAMRAVTVLTSADQSVLVAARGFSALGTGLALRVTCASPLDAEAELDDVAPEAVVAVVGPF